MQYRLHVTLTNETRGHVFSQWSEDAADWYHTPGKLFRECQREYGRCMSKVYVDRENAPAVPIGWYFEKRQEYEDGWRREGKPETYIRGAWVTFEEIPTRPRPVRTARHAGVSESWHRS